MNTNDRSIIHPGLDSMGKRKKNAFFLIHLLTIFVFLLALSNASYAAPKISSVSPRVIQLRIGTPVTLMLRGTGLNAIRGVALNKDKGGRQRVSGLTGKFSGTAMAGKLTVTFRGRAPSGNYYIHVTNGRSAIAILPVSVKVSAGSMARRPVQARTSAASTRSNALAQRQAADVRRKALAQRQAADVRKKALAQRQAADVRRKALAQRQAADVRRKALAQRQAADVRRKALAQRQAADVRRKALAQRQASDVRRKTLAQRQAADARKKALAQKQAADARTKALAQRQAADARTKALAQRQAADVRRTALALKKTADAKRKVTQRKTAQANRRSIAEDSRVQKKINHVNSKLGIKGKRTTIQHASSKLPSQLNHTTKNIPVTNQQVLQGSGVNLNRGLAPNGHNLNRIKITSFSINNGASETAIRAVNLKLTATNGPIRAYRICEESPNRYTATQGCDISHRPWISYTSNISYTLQTPTFDSAGKDKTLYIQIKGNPLPSPTIRNVTVDNFSTLMHASIKHVETPEFTTTPSIKYQFKAEHYHFVVKGISADRLTATFKHMVGGCNINLGNSAPIVQGNKISANQFDITIINVASSNGFNQATCTGMLKLEAQNVHGASLGSHLLSYTQEFHPYEARKITVNNTYQLLSSLNIKKETTLIGDQGFTICEGNSAGSSGVKKMGVVNEGGDLVIKTRSSPVGRSCEYSLHANLKKGWLVTMNYTEIKDGSGCVVSHDGQPRHLAPMALAFNRGKKYIGWKTEENLFGGYRAQIYDNQASNGERLRIFLTCSPSLSNNHGVKSVLSSVDIEVPPFAHDNATWQDAFN